MKIYSDVHVSALAQAINATINEHESQFKKWGRQDRTLFEWLTYLTEEVGELAEAISELEYREGNIAEVSKEAIQVAALATRISAIVSQPKGEG